jgi:hypothetical protein
MEGRTVTIKEILDDVLDMKPKHEAAIAIFIQSFSCHACRSFHHGYTTIHGVENLVRQIPFFFTGFCPEICARLNKLRLYDTRYASAERADVIH